MRIAIAFALSSAIVSAACGGGGAPAPISVSLPRPAHGESSSPLPAAPAAHLTGNLAWWTKLDIDSGFPALQISPDANGGAEVEVVKVIGDSKGFSAAGTVTLHLDANGRATPAIPKIEDDVLAKKFPRALISAHVRANDGGTIIAGTMYEPVDFGGGLVGDKSWSGPAFIAAFDAKGKHVFSHAFDVYDLYGSERLTITADGNVTMIFKGGDKATPDFGGGKLSADGPHGFMVTFDGMGKHVRSAIIALDIRESRVAPNGDVVVSGTSPGEKQYERERFVVRIDANGHERWRHSFGDEQTSDDAIGIAFDASENVLAAVSQLTFGERRETWTDLVLLDDAGSALFTKRIEGLAEVREIAFGPNGDAFLGGAAGKDTITFASKSLSFAQGGLFVMKLGK